MRIEGRYEFQADRRSVWRALQDPELLAATLPGVKRLAVIARDRYEVTADVGVGSVKGSYDGTFSVDDKKDFESCMLRGSARGGAGSIEVQALTRLSDANGGGTLLVYEADAKLAGPVAGVGQRMIGAASKRMSNQFFGALDAALTGERVPAPSPEAERPTEVGRIYSKPPAPSGDNNAFLKGLAVGFALAVAGVIVGRRTATHK